MNLGLIVLLVAGIAGTGVVLRGQDDFLTSQEIDSIRDAQEAGERIRLHLEFAQRRLDAVKTHIASSKPNVGSAVQKSLKEYIAILEALEDTILGGREQRSPLEKALKEVEKQGAEFLKYLESLQSESSPGFQDYRYTLDEAIEMTRDEMEEAKKGAFRKTEGRGREDPFQVPKALSELTHAYPAGAATTGAFGHHVGWRGCPGSRGRGWI